MKNKTNKFKYVIYICTVASVLVHISFMPIKFNNLESKLVKTVPEKIRIKFVNKNKDNVKQMAETNKSVSQIEKEASFLSDSNNSFTKQTKAKNVGRTNNAGLGNSKVDSISKAENTPKQEVKKEKRNLKDKKNTKVSFKDFSFTKADEVVREKRREVKGEKNGDVKNRGLAQSSDYLEDIPLGDMTNLNTKEHVYYGFYYRIKLKLEQHWGATLKEKMEALYKKNGRFPASDKYITNIRVTLDSTGTIKNIKLEGSSGVDELDSAAIESFNRAGPFPNPPKGMVINNEAQVEWGFAVTNS